MRKIFTVIGVALSLSACSTPQQMAKEMMPQEVIISQTPGYSSAPEWITIKSGDVKDVRFQVEMAEADGDAMTSAVEKLAGREARRAFAASVQADIQSFAKDEMGMSDTRAEQVAQETVSLKASGIRVEKTYWQKFSDPTGTIRIRAWAYATMPKKEFDDAIKAAKSKARGMKVVSEETWKDAKEKWKAAE